MIDKLTQGNGTSRMQRVEAMQEPQAMIQPPAQTGSTAPSTPSGPIQGGAPQQQGGAGTSFVDYVATALHDSSTFEQHVGMIKQGAQGAAQVAVTIGQSAVAEHQQRGIEPSVEEQGAALELVLDDITDIYMQESPEGQGGNREQAEYNIAKAALPMWAQAMGMDPNQLAQEIAADATPEDEQMAQQFHQGSQAQPATV